MKAQVIRIGNSKGIRLPATMLKHLHIKDAVDIEAKKDSIVIRPQANVRVGWEEAFKRMAQVGDDALVDKNLKNQSKWDKDEGKW